MARRRCLISNAFNCGRRYRRGVMATRDVAPEGEVPGSASGQLGLLAVRRAGALRRQFALRNDPLPIDREPVVTVRVRAGEEMTLHWIHIALSCARDQVWAQSWEGALDRAAHPTILIDTPFSQSLDASFAGTDDFRYAVDPLPDGTSLWAYVCAVDGFPPLILPCAITRASALEV
jgi:hypothetical protein